ncbi:hypothetical protein VOLCADRAFT_95893 [Volvox carteri f. nagariensis]|uniref:Uncharacterized protein n=1 Tax=Volvox carteri f. nagariensis TaxID=3068 RepID=D8U8N0_VOLCA|nr:uncharacterized protein VOLCADRAFT_95893 [Volvox carteri f. nagariensis]EFJ43950.1 hypothetical protein VOLCADRAFT_95893 [Volvox carteri f. nagariensis]|eukprot:XP_002954962.1 hypothetical protein VOLCADRAFT_95893 [Volvox carteri f. nagariensis]
MSMDIGSLCASSAVWSSSLLLMHIASYLPRNFIACSLRLVDKHSRELFRGQDYTTIHLSEACSIAVFEQYWEKPEATQKMSITQRIQLVCLTSASGVLENLQVALNAADCAPVEEMMEAAAAAGSLQSCKWLRARGCPWGKALAAAGLGGHQEVFEYLMLMGCTCDDDALYAPARGGHWGLMEWLSLTRPSRNGKVHIGKLMAAAAEGCDLNAFQKLHDVWLGGFTGLLRATRHQLYGPKQSAVLVAAASSPSPDWRAKVEWLEAKRYPRSPEVAAAAASLPDGRDRLRWLQERGYPMGLFNSETFRKAGRAGNFPLVQYLLQEFVLYNFTRDAAEAAAEAGQLDFLKALHALCQLDSEASRSLALYACRSGHQAVVAWAVQELQYDASGDPEALSAAAESGNVALMAWIWARSQLSSGKCMEGAVKSGCREALQWMEEHGLLMKGDLGTMYYIAARNGDLATLRWIRGRLPGTLPEGLISRCVHTSCPPSAIRWLVELDDQPDWLTAELGAALHCVHSWLQLQRIPSLTTSRSSSTAAELQPQQLEEMQQALQAELEDLVRKLQLSPSLRMEPARVHLAAVHDDEQWSCSGD